MQCNACGGVLTCEPWCPTSNGNVQYARRVLNDPNFMTQQDGMILHALGVKWDDNQRPLPPPEPQTIDYEPEVPKHSNLKF